MPPASLSEDDPNFPQDRAQDAGVPNGRTTPSSRAPSRLAPSWDDLACEIRRLFKGAIASTAGGMVDDGRTILCAERILDATGSMAIHAELMSDDRGARLSFSIDQCEAEAQRLFDSLMGGQSAAVLNAYAERGLIASYGLQDMFTSISH
jgi:hypothetical protein